MRKKNGHESRTRVQAEDGESDDSLVDEDRVSLAAADELRERERDGRSADGAHRDPSLFPAWGVLVPELSDHVHEHARALALDRGRVRTLDQRENLMQPRRLGILALRRQRQIVAIIS